MARRVLDGVVRSGRVPAALREPVMVPVVEGVPVDAGKWVPGKVEKATAEAVARERKRRERSAVAVAARERYRAVQAWAALDAAAVVEQMARGALYDPREFYESEDGPVGADGEPRWRVGDLKPMHRLTEAQAQCVTAVEVVMKNAVAGDGKIDRVLKIRFAPREKYVELAARYHGLLVDKTESHVTVSVVGSKLEAARARLAAGLTALPAPGTTEPKG